MTTRKTAIFASQGFLFFGGVFWLQLTSNALKTIENILFEQKLTFRKAH